MLNAAVSPMSGGMAPTAAPQSGASDFSGSALGVLCDMNVTDALSLVSASSASASAAAYAILYTFSPAILPLPTTL